jgi:hypothetical protein
VRTLETLRCTGFEEPCWGYHFDVQTRVFFYPKGSPNTIASAFAGLALLDAHDAIGEQRLLQQAIGVGEFFLRHVPQTPDANGGAYFGYLVGDSTPIHNANMLVCSLLAKLATRTQRADMHDAATAGITWTLGYQRPDGSWPYGERPSLHWVDNFHTGYVLDALMVARDAGIDPDAGGALERGLEYYRRALFLDDGTPKYLPDSVFPIDAQCVAQGIKTMSIAGSRDQGHAAFARRIFEYAQSRMQRPDGAYIFQRRRHWCNRAPHMRWVVAPMFEALAHLQRLRGSTP